MKKALHISLLLALSSAAAGARAAADPCDFGSGAATFAHEQVLRCYQQVPLDPAAQRNITSVIEQARSFSDLSELYEQRVGWKRRLRAIEGQSFASDFELQQALVLEHKAFRNPHVLYQPPACYSELLAAFLPLELGSALSGQGAGAQQIVFVQSGGLSLAGSGCHDSPAMPGKRASGCWSVDVRDNRAAATW